MRLHVVGLSHRTAPVELRECVDFARGGVDVALKALAVRGICQETVVLSTCNRAEVYAVTESDEVADRIAGFFSEYHQLDQREVADHLYTLRGGDAARHLFRVAAGLDSLVVGEPQILGQVKSAYTTASDLQFTGPLLNRLFHSSFAVGKRVRSETGLGEGAVSISYAAIALAKKIFGKLSGLNVLILGAGEMAKLTAIHLKAQHVRHMTIASRTLAAAEGLAARLDAKAAPWTDLERALASADIVVTATGATEPVLTRRRVEDVMRPRRNRPLFIIDIAVPRDVDAGVGDLEGVFLYNIDDLQAIVKENLARRTGELELAEAIVTEEVTQFTSWMQSRDIIPTVVALRQRFEAIRQSELLRLEPKLAGLPPEARVRIDEITRLIVEKLLLTPTEQLKSVSDETTVVAYADALNRLFRLAAEEQARSAAEPNSTSKVGRR
jgi:glutamyl-tRNA reductase